MRDLRSNNYAKICVKRSEQLDLASQVLKQLQLLDQQAKTLKREVCDLEAQIKECEAEMPMEEDHSALTAAAAAAPQAVSPATLAAMASKMGLGSEMSARADMAGLIIRDLYELYQDTQPPHAQVRTCRWTSSVLRRTTCRRRSLAPERIAGAAGAGDQLTRVKLLLGGLIPRTCRWWILAASSRSQASEMCIPLTSYRDC